MKPISTRLHGIMDYLTAALLIVLPFILRWDEDLSGSILMMAGIGMLLVSLCTRYELGAMKAIPMPVHLGIDFMMGLLLIAAPFLFISQDTMTKTVLFIVLGVSEIAAALLTQHEPRYASIRPASATA